MIRLLSKEEFLQKGYKLERDGALRKRGDQTIYSHMIQYLGKCYIMDSMDSACTIKAAGYYWEATSYEVVQPIYISKITYNRICCDSNYKQIYLNKLKYFLKKDNYCLVYNNEFI